MLSEYLSLTEETCENLEKKGVIATPFARPTAFESLKDEKAQKQAILQAKNYQEWSKSIDEKLKLQQMSSFSQELRNNDLALDAALTCAFQGYGLDYKSFPKLVDKGDVIDAYTLDFKQVYCNENFFKTPVIP